MHDPYSDVRDGNPYAYYEEDTSARPPMYLSGEEPSRQEPRTPMIVRLEKMQSFRLILLSKTYKLVVMRDYCELVVNDQATDVVITRSEASDRLKVGKNYITIINENGRKHKFLMAQESFGEIKRARLALWCRENLPSDPLAAYSDVRNLMFDYFFASLFTTAIQFCIVWLSMLIMLVIPLLLSGFRDETSLVATIVTLAFTVYYATIAGLVMCKRRAVFSSAMILILMLPVAAMLLLFFVFPVFIIPAMLAAAPAFWLGIKILAFRGSVSKLREDNVALFTFSKTDV